MMLTFFGLLLGFELLRLFFGHLANSRFVLLFGLPNKFLLFAFLALQTLLVSLFGLISFLSFLRLHRIGLLLPAIERIHHQVQSSAFTATNEKVGLASKKPEKAVEQVGHTTMFFGQAKQNIVNVGLLVLVHRKAVHKSVCSRTKF